MAAENHDFGRFVTTWYNVHCKHTQFFEFLGLLNDFFLRSLVLGVRVGFGGREGALASALICNVIRRAYCSINIKYALFSGIFTDKVYLNYYISLVCQDKMLTNFRSNYLLFCQNINGNKTSFKLNILMSDLVT